MSGRFVEELIDSALKEAGMPERPERPKGELEEGRAYKIASLLKNVAESLNEMNKNAYRKDALDEKKDEQISGELRKLFIGENLEEDEVQQKDYLKRRIEQLGGITAPKL